MTNEKIKAALEDFNEQNQQVKFLGGNSQKACIICKPETYDVIRALLEAQTSAGEEREGLKVFFDEWFGPAFGPPEHLERIESRRQKSRIEFAEKLSAFLAARRYAASQQTRGEVPEGWKLVPIEPTEEMRFAAGTLSRWYKDQRTHVEIYKAMLTASPTPPVAGKDRGE